MKRPYLLLACLSPVACLMAASGQKGGKNKQKVNDRQLPNVVFIYADDLGYGDLECYGAKNVQTPNVNRLASEGIRFTNAHATAATSTPSRYSMLTGEYAWRRPGTDVAAGNAGMIIRPEDYTMADMFKNSGYVTAALGKWHLGLESPNLPNERGFDFFHGFLGDMMDDYNTHLRRGFNYMRLNTEEIDPQGHATDLFTDWASDYIFKARKQDKPFFLYLAYNAPHSPLQPPVEWEKKVRKRHPNISETRGKLVALIEHMDDGVGRVINSLEKSGQLDNTLIIFCSDNGGDRKSEANNGPVRGDKGDMYDGGIKVACSLYWKGHLEHRRVNNLVMMSDIFPTLCDLVQLPVNHRIDGISVLPLLRNQEQVTDDRYLFWVRRENAVRYKEYNLLQNRPFEPLQYFNMKQDSKESQPLEKDAVYSKLYKAMVEHYRISGAIPWQRPLTK